MVINKLEIEIVKLIRLKMKIRNTIRRIKSIRMKGYDYSSKEAFHVTICAQNKECRFGIVENEKLILNKTGIMISECWI
ncbi:MAG: hypothetical protein HGGPFJEG_02273 [Ignavibacteria bacterium]|nr:hypothetical protein [Ignavibacteria bacterium]